MPFVVPYSLAMLVWFYTNGVAMVFTVKWDKSTNPGLQSNTNYKFTQTNCSNAVWGDLNYFSPRGYMTIWYLCKILHVMLAYASRNKFHAGVRRLHKAALSQKGVYSHVISHYLQDH
jgi:hypothetical protein